MKFGFTLVRHPGRYIPLHVYNSGFKCRKA